MQTPRRRFLVCARWAARCPLTAPLRPLMRGLWLCACGVAMTALAAPPRIIHPNADYVALYEEAWREAAERTLQAPPGAPIARYMDENVYDDQIWIWDSCFMAQFTKYAAADYPGIETLEALYVPVVEGGDSPLLIHLYDNPPLFAWCEWRHWQFHGDRARLHEVIQKRRLLQRHYAWFAAPPTGTRPKASPNEVLLAPAIAGNGAPGFRWWGNRSGMDNTPRGRSAGGYGQILWVDALAQQALSARCIAKLCRAAGETQEAAQWEAAWRAAGETLNAWYWDEADGFYYDLALTDGTPCRVKTIASFWPLAAGLVPPDRARRLIAHLRNPAEFGGLRPLPSLSRDDPDYDAQTGDYWRGAIWLPTAYMVVEALDEAGDRALADTFAQRILDEMVRVYHTERPATIWECYSAERDVPSTEYGRRVRPGFCGWSALGPINFFIERILGLREVNAPEARIVWEPPDGAAFPMGIEGLIFGETTLSLWSDNRTLRATTTRPLMLRYNGRTFSLPIGTSTFQLSGREP